MKPEKVGQTLRQFISMGGMGGMGGISMLEPMLKQVDMAIEGG